MNNNKTIPFSKVPVRTIFYLEGVRWYKRSKTTANVLGHSDKWKRFCKTDQVIL